MLTHKFEEISKIKETAANDIAHYNNYPHIYLTYNNLSNVNRFDIRLGDIREDNIL